MLDLVGKMLWPAIAITIVILFYEPIIKKLNESNEIQVGPGTFSLKIKERATQVGDPLLAQTIGELSEHAIEKLVDTGTKAMQVSYVNEKNNEVVLYGDFINYLELERAGFLKVKTNGQEVTGLLGVINRGIWNYEPTQEIVFKQTSGRRTYIISPLTDMSRSRYFFNLSDIPKEEINILRDLNVQLSDKGLKAWDLIIKEVIQQIKSSEGNRVGKPNKALNN